MIKQNEDCKMYNNRLVTVLIPTHNRPQFVFQALESVLNQTHQNFEIIISDDSDTDNSIEMFKEIQCLKRHKR